MIANRLEATLTYSLYRWLTTVDYKLVSMGPSGTLSTHFAIAGQPPLTILPAYPDDLSMIAGPTLAISGPLSGGAGTRFIGEGGGGEPGSERLFTVSVYGFVAGYGSDGYSRLVRDHLISDLMQLFEEVGSVEGIALYEVESDTVAGRFDIAAVRHRVIPVNAPAIDAERYKFLVEADIQFA